MKTLLIALSFVLASAPVHAQMQTIEYSKAFSVRHLAGVAMDPSGATVPDVEVEICKEGWSDCVASTTTGSDGRFAFAGLPHENLYYLKVSARGFDQLHMKVRLRTFGPKELIVKMHIAA